MWKQQETKRYSAQYSCPVFHTQYMKHSVFPELLNWRVNYYMYCKTIFLDLVKKFATYWVNILGFP